MSRGIRVGKLFVSIGTDQSALNKGFDQAEKKTRGLGRKLGRIAGGAGKLLAKGIIVGTALAGAALAGFSVKAIKVASDLEEVQNVVDTTFEDMSGTINKFAKDAGKQFGLSELAGKQFASGIGAVLTPTGLGTPAITEMSRDLAGLSGDMASFFNVANEDAFGALRAGIIGETEPLKRFGIVMSQANLDAFALAQGLEKTTKEMNQAELATLRYNFIMDATAKVQGDFAKTSGSLANQQRIFSLNIENLAAIFGKRLLPIAGKALQGINGLIDELMPQFEGLADSLVGIMSGADGAAESFRLTSQVIITKIIGMITNVLPKIAEVGVNLVMAIIEGVISVLPTLADMAVKIVTTIVTELIRILPSLINVAAEIIDTLVWGIVSLLPVLVDAVPIILDTLINAILDLLPSLIWASVQIIFTLADGLIETIPVLLNAVPLIVDALVDALITLAPALIIASLKIILALIEGLHMALPQLVNMLPTLIETIIDEIVMLLPFIVELGAEILTALILGLMDNVPLLILAIIEIGGILFEALKELSPILFEAGKDLIKGLMEGMKHVDFGGYVERLKNNVVRSFKEAFEINSPSALMGREIAPDVAAGIVSPPSSVMNGLKNKLTDMANTLAAGAGSGLSAAAAGPGGTTIVFESISVAIPNGSPEEARRAGEIIGQTAATKLMRARGNN